MNIAYRIRSFVKNRWNGFRYRYRYSRSPLPQISSTLGEKLLFVTGFDKSGTTWLRQSLNDHPQICCYGCGQFFDYFQENVHFLGHVGGYQVMLRSMIGNDWYKRAGEVWFSHQSIEEFLRAALEAQMLRFRDNDAVSLVGDKSTVQDCSLIRTVFPKAKIVAIVRDGRDVAVSFAYHFKRRGNEGHFRADKKLDLKFLEDVAKAWSIYNDHLYSFREKGDEGFFLIKYEDLLSRPEGIFKDLFTFLRVSSDASTVSRIVTGNRFQILSGGRAPGEQNENSFFRKGIAGDWINYFGDTENSIFQTFAGKTLRSFDYADAGTFTV